MFCFIINGWVWFPISIHLYVLNLQMACWYQYYCFSVIGVFFLLQKQPNFNIIYRQHNYHFSSTILTLSMWLCGIDQTKILNALHCMAREMHHDSQLLLHPDQLPSSWQVLVSEPSIVHYLEDT